MNVPSLTINFKEACNIKVEGINNKANNILICEIPKLKKYKNYIKKNLLKIQLFS